MKKQLMVEFDCANCALKAQEAIKKMDGVVNCNVNYMTTKIDIEFGDDVNIDDKVKEVKKTILRVEPDAEIL